MTALLRITCQGHAVVLGQPVGWLNGAPVPLRFGVNELHVAPGDWTVQVALPHALTGPYGRTLARLAVGPGDVVDLWYAPPLHRFGRGRLGREPQQHQGRGFWVAILAVVLVPQLAFAMVCAGAWIASALRG